MHELAPAGHGDVRTSAQGGHCRHGTRKEESQHGKFAVYCEYTGVETVTLETTVGAAGRCMGKSKSKNILNPNLHGFQRRGPTLATEGLTEKNGGKEILIFYVVQDAVGGTRRSEPQSVAQWALESLESALDASRRRYLAVFFPGLRFFASTLREYM